MALLVIHVVIFLAPWLNESYSARRVDNGCASATLNVSSSTGNNRMLVAIAAKYAPWRTQYLFAVVHEYLGDYKGWSVDVVVDTDDERLSEVLQQRFPRDAWGRGKTLAVNVWSRLDLHLLGHERFASGERLDMFLAQAHRTYFHKRLASYDFFVYSEDDMVLPRAAFQYYTQSYAELWARGWTFAFFRVEGSPLRLTDHQWGTLHDPTVRNPLVYAAPSGATYVQLPEPYHALWVLDRQQMTQFAATREYVTGINPYGIRERFAVGWHWTAPTLFNSPRNRALSPIHANGSLVMEAAVFHLPVNYHAVARDVEGFLQWSGPMTRAPLPMHPAWAC
jgi:hypothetical protein